MKRILVLVLAILFLFSTGVFAEQANKLVGDARSVDTKYTSAYTVNLPHWFETHPLPAGQKLMMQPIFVTPRVAVMAAANKGQLIDFHYHSQADELVLAVKGQCEQYMDGKWVVMKPGDIHYNPRGVIHATRVTGDEPFYAVSIFTPSTAVPDRVFLNTDITTAKPGAKIGDWSMLDTQYKKGYIINLDEWYASHPLSKEQPVRSEPAMGTMRNQLMIAQRPALGVHYHGSADEIIYTYKGQGEMYINGVWTKLNPGDMHFCPRGLIHGIHPAGDGEFKIFAVFTPPQANLSDRIFVDLK